MPEKHRHDFDGPWKAALETWFEPFLHLVHPELHAAIDWTKPIEFLDTEVGRVTRDAEVGSGRVDKLVEVICGTATSSGSSFKSRCRTRRSSGSSSASSGTGAA